MKKRLFLLLLAITMTLTACVTPTSAEKNEIKKEEQEEMIDLNNNYTLTEENVKLLGRTSLNADILWCALSGTGIEFNLKGTKAEITILGDSAAKKANNNDNYARVAVYVGDERIIDTAIDAEKKTLTLFESYSEKEVKISVVKLSESAMSVIGLTDLNVAGKITPTPKKDLLIEFVGDSITCGYGVDDEVKEHHFSTSTEDVTKAYAYKTASALNADYSMVSMSGYGIISGYSNDGKTKVPAQTVPQYYSKIGFSYDTFGGTAVSSTLWDYNRLPDVVVINLGTNDDSYVKGDKDKGLEYKDAYVDFLGVVREKNPDAIIVGSLGIMGNGLMRFVEMAVDEFKEATGDKNVYTHRFDVQDANDGYAADWHPTEKTHEKAAKGLTSTLKKLLAIKDIDPDKPVIALSFDDGPNTTTTVEVIEKLKKYDIAATFFVIGNNINDETGAVMKSAYDMGNEIANHSKTHSYMDKLDAKTIQDEIEYTSNLVEKYTGEPTYFFRPPYISVNDVMFENISLPFISGFGAEDWEEKRDAEYRAKRIIAQAVDGGIILLHDMTGNDKTVEALDTIIPALLSEGYQFVTMSQLFDIKGVTPKGNIVYSNALQTSMY